MDEEESVNGDVSNADVPISKSSDGVLVPLDQATMAKDDILLREEMGRLEIEPVKVNKIRKVENPFNYQRNIVKRVNIPNLKCSCSLEKRNKYIGISKKRQNKILKDPVLKILKSCIHSRLTERKDYQHTQCLNILPSSEPIDTLNLCTLVHNCNQLKISSGSNEQSLSGINNLNNEINWWKNDISCTKDNKEPKPSNHTGSCSQQALNPPCDITIDELASYFETLVHIPKKMSSMAEMMYI